MAAVLRIPFALRESDQRMVDPTMVDRGRKCGCICPECHARLVARRGKIKVPHFAHAAACPGAYETCIHRAAKQIIEDLGFIWLPPSITRVIPSRFQFASCEPEKSDEQIRPDLTLRSPAGRELAVEILVTHEIGPGKLAELQRRRLSCVEYDLSHLPRTISYETLKSQFAGGKLDARWLYNRKDEEEKQKRKEAIARARQEAKWRWVTARKSRYGVTVYHVDHCPLQKRWYRGHAFAYADTDCQACDYFCGTRGNRQVKCGGHASPEARQRWAEENQLNLRLCSSPQLA
ncbi:MAG: competence protein CoiA family protein [Opitutaceae bacterium]|nr:competence protein CoiA family protein [Opitutaceae bacterium]